LSKNTQEEWILKGISRKLLTFFTTQKKNSVKRLKMDVLSGLVHMTTIVDYSLTQPKEV
jgi:hypothetical protein